MSGLKCNIDADMVAYEVAVQGQYVDEDGETVILSYQAIEDYIEQRVDEIKEAVGSTREPTMFLTGNGNFRFDVAKRKPYKGNRNKEKPFHLANVRVCMQSMYDTNISPDDEADDELAIAQREDTVCCSRDKDLRQIPGLHYGWESGLQAEQPLHMVEGMGFIKGEFKYGISLKTGNPTRQFKKLLGEGYLFFLSQMLMGDVVDNIPGCKGIGGARVCDSLVGITVKEDALSVVEEIFQEVYSEETWLEELEEQARLVWMVRGRDEKGKLLHWSLKDAKACTTYEM